MCLRFLFTSLQNCLSSPFISFICIFHFLKISLLSFSTLLLCSKRACAAFIFSFTGLYKHFRSNEVDVLQFLWRNWKVSSWSHHICNILFSSQSKNFVNKLYIYFYSEFSYWDLFCIWAFTIIWSTTNRCVFRMIDLNLCVMIKDLSDTV